MADEVQDMVDQLGAELGCAVAVDDDRMDLRAYSPQFGAIDEVRAASILQRTADPAVVEYASRFNIRQARRAVRIPENPDLGLMPRVCITLWRKHERLGYLWLIEPEPALDDAQVVRAEQVATDIAVVLAEERWRNEVERGRERELMRDLLAVDPALRAHAASQLVQTERFSTARRVQVLAVRVSGDTAALSEFGRRQFEAAMREARRILPTGSAAHLAHPDHGLLILVGRVVDDSCNEVCERLRTAIAGEGGCGIVGVGSVRPSLTEARGSYEQALTAIRVAEVVPTLGPVAHWRELGVYRVLAQLPAQELTAEALDPRLLALFSAEHDGVLTSTLETYLECGGDTRRTIDRLVLHRTSLYSRLEKIARITGIDVADGNDRLAMHLGLKIALLAGVHPTVSTGAHPCRTTP